MPIYDKKTSILTFEEDTYIPFINLIVKKGTSLKVPSKEQMLQFYGFYDEDEQEEFLYDL